ncbi:hypothetical protein D3C71_1901720 [compost metagenome]
MEPTSTTVSRYTCGLNKVMTTSAPSTLQRLRRAAAVVFWAASPSAFAPKEASGAVTMRHSAIRP